MTEVHALNIGCLADLTPGELAAFMPERYRRAMKYRREEDRLRCFAAGLLLRCVVPLEDERALRYDERGKPYIDGGPEFNISHSGDYAVLAADCEPLGIDIERLDAANLVIAPAVFDECELAWMSESPLERFHALWTLKESVAKATGLGLALSPKSFSALPIAPGRPREYAGVRLYSRWTRYADCALACATRRDSGDIRVSEWRYDSESKNLFPREL